MLGRAYQLNGYEDDFYTGLTDDGRQALMGLLCPNLVVYFFSPEGVLLGHEVRPWRHPAPGSSGQGYHIYDSEFQHSLAEQFSEWSREIGLKSGGIQVQRFFDEEECVGIEDLPEHYENLDLWEDPDERQLVEQERREWLTQGQFVFWWAKDYYMAADGEVDST